MLTRKKLEEEALLSLRLHFGEREASQILRLLKEDLPSKAARTKGTSYEDLMVEGVARVSAGEPVQYITGNADFYGLRLHINRKVLIPRPETEELVHWLLDETEPDNRSCAILDVGTGSGCIALALKKKLPNAKITALDISEDAISTARTNALRLGLEIELIQTDFMQENNWKALPKFDIIISNPPYIEEEEKDKMSKSTLHYEPHQALFNPDENKKLAFYLKLADFGKVQLNENGRIFAELNEFHPQEIEHIFFDQGYSTQLREDMQGKVRMLMATLQ